MEDEETVSIAARMTFECVKAGVRRFSDLIAYCVEQHGREQAAQIFPCLSIAWKVIKEDFPDDEFDDAAPLEEFFSDDVGSAWNSDTEEIALSALDELFEASQNYRSSKQYLELMQFIRKFPRYSPFNCFLLHTQKPSVSYVATAGQWRKKFNRTIKAGARPLVILAPMSPVLFVFDAEDTQGPPLPPGLLSPFQTQGDPPSGVWDKTLGNLPRDLILESEIEMARTSAGWIMKARPEDFLAVGKDRIKANYHLRINKSLDCGGKYATLAHELGHLYAGHIGTPDERWWPNRTGLTLTEREFEAESICYLVCERAGVQNPSAAYLSGYLEKNRDVPQISLDTVLKAAGHVEEMGKRKLKPRKEVKATV